MAIPTRAVCCSIGAFNPLLGRSYTEIAAESRSMHKSQGFGAAERRGTFFNYFDQLAGDPAKDDIFAGIDTSWSRYACGDAIGFRLAKAYNRLPEPLVKVLQSLLAYTLDLVPNGLQLLDKDGTVFL